MSPRAAWRLEALGFSKIFDYMPGKLDWMAYGLPVDGKETHLIAMQLIRDWPACCLTERIADAGERVRAAGAPFCAVLNDESVVLGVVHAEDLEAERASSVEEIMDSAPTTLRPSYSVEDATQFLRENNQPAVLVTSSDGRLMGAFRVRGTERRKN